VRTNALAFAYYTHRASGTLLRLIKFYFSCLFGAGKQAGAHPYDNLVSFPITSSFDCCAFIPFSRGAHTFFSPFLCGKDSENCARSCSSFSRCLFPTSSLFCRPLILKSENGVKKSSLSSPAFSYFPFQWGPYCFTSVFALILAETKKGDISASRSLRFFDKSVIQDITSHGGSELL
jgi:hypothetical protein